MEHFDGRPVWHCSVSPKWRAEVAASVIRNVGQGEVFLEDGGVAIHMRRHITDSELAQIGGPGAIRDVRGTPEEEERLAPVRAYLPKDWTEAPIEEGETHGG